MSNKLKTLSPTQLETLISDIVGDYLDEECSCEISDLNTPNIDSEADIALQDQRSIEFNVRLTYSDPDTT